MIVGLGTDVVEIDRVADVLARHGDRFLERTFTEAERAYCDRAVGRAKAQRYAARFAAKEACAKALRTGIGAGASLLEMEVVRLVAESTEACKPDPDGSGPPTLRLSGTAEQTAAALGVRRIWLTLAHERSVAVATVVLED